MDQSKQFQTPPEVCRYMASLIPEGVVTVLEPTPGEGNLVNALHDYDVTAPVDYFNLKHAWFDCVVMNPPFSARSAILDNAPTHWLEEKGMKMGYRFLRDCMNRSHNIIALMPWFVLTDSDVRTRLLKSFGLISITALPRKTFEYARIQTCVLYLSRGYLGPTEFKVYDLLPEIPEFKQNLIAETV